MMSYTEFFVRNKAKYEAEVPPGSDREEFVQTQCLKAWKELGSRGRYNHSKMIEREGLKRKAPFKEIKPPQHKLRILENSVEEEVEDSKKTLAQKAGHINSQIHSLQVMIHKIDEMLASFSKMIQDTDRAYQAQIIDSQAIATRSTELKNAAAVCYTNLEFIHTEAMKLSGIKEELKILNIETKAKLTEKQKEIKEQFDIIESTVSTLKNQQTQLQGMSKAMSNTMDLVHRNEEISNQLLKRSVYSLTKLQMMENALDPKPSNNL